MAHLHVVASTELSREACVRVVAAEGLTLPPSYRPGCGCTAMPGNRVLFPVVNIQYTEPCPVTPNSYRP